VKGDEDENLLMTKLRQPTNKELISLAKASHFSLTPEELAVFQSSIGGILHSYNRLDRLARTLGASESRSVSATLSSRKGHRPTREENPLGAWAWKCSIRVRRPTGRSSFAGKLEGKRIAIKDNVAVARIPMQNGSPMLRGFIPSMDATIVSRILEEGGEILGKSNCENLCVSGGSHTSYPEPVRNPRNPKYMAGGSSSGSAALLAAGDVDMAIGGDQGGSIRLPASWCGVVGLKPTTGLVPYTGIMGMDPLLDHTGPMANKVRDVALLLQVIAGRDGYDPRQLNTPPKLPDYVRELNKNKGATGLKIGIVEEGFNWPGLSERDVDKGVKESAYSFGEIGAKVSEISIPAHRDARHVWAGVGMEGIWHNMTRDNGLEHAWCGPEDLQLVERWARALKESGDQMAENAKLISLAGNYVASTYNGRYYALARNLRRSLIRAYDNFFEKFDLLAMPTTPQKAQPFDGAGGRRNGRSKKRMSLKRELDLTGINMNNTCAFDVTGHPAISLPCGTSQGLPLGLMLVGRYYEETTILCAASAFEKKSMAK